MAVSNKAFPRLEFQCFFVSILKCEQHNRISDRFVSSPIHVKVMQSLRLARLKSDFEKPRRDDGASLSGCCTRPAYAAR